MTNGNLTKLLTHIGVSRYFEFKFVENGYIYLGGKFFKVLCNQEDLLGFSNLLKIFEIPENVRFRNFLIYVQDFQEADGSTWKAFDPNTSNMQVFFDKFNLSRNSHDCIGHVLASYTDDEYLLQPAIQTIKRIKLYIDFQNRYGKSPFLYPMYGNAEILQSFARIFTIYGGTFLLNKPVDEIGFGEGGQLIGVRSGEKVFKCNQLYCDPSYVPNRIRKSGQVIRCICILDHPIPNTDNALSAQIVIPQNQLGRNSDIYVCLVSNTFEVAPKGKFIATVSAKIETNNPEEEITPALELLGPIRQKFVSISDYYEPIDDGLESKIFISKSYDATSNFETTCLDIFDIYKRGSGEEFDFSTRFLALGEEDI